MQKEVKISPLMNYYIPMEMIWAKTSSHRNEYCCGTVLENISEMMKNVHEGIMDTLKLNGYNSITDLEDERVLGFCWIYISTMIEIFIKSGVPYIFEELRKPKYNYEERYKVNKKVQVKENEDIISYDVEMREKSGTLKDQYNSNREEKENKAEAIRDLRNLLYSTKFELRGKRVSNSKVTFTSWVNELLVQIAPEYISLNKSLFSKDTSVKIKDINKLKEKLRNLYQEDVKVVIK